MTGWSMRVLKPRAASSGMYRIRCSIIYLMRLSDVGIVCASALRKPRPHETLPRHRAADRDHGGAPRSRDAAARGTWSRTSRRSRPTRSRKPTRSPTRSPANDMRDLRDELGDLLLQVVYHARMAEEIGAFAFPDVVEAITTKLIRRHPHVFGDADARAAGAAKGIWEKIKAEEKAARRAERGESPDRTGLLDDVAARPSAADPRPEAAGEGVDRRLRLERSEGRARQAPRGDRRDRGGAGGAGPCSRTGSRTRSATCCSPSSISRGTSRSIPSRRSAAPTSSSCDASRRSKQR